MLNVRALRLCFKVCETGNTGSRDAMENCFSPSKFSVVWCQWSILQFTCITRRPSSGARSSCNKLVQWRWKLLYLQNSTKCIPCWCRFRHGSLSSYNFINAASCGPLEACDALGASVRLGTNSLTTKIGARGVNALAVLVALARPEVCSLLFEDHGISQSTGHLPLFSIAPTCA